MERLVYKNNGNYGYSSMATIPYPKSEMHLFILSLNPFRDWVEKERDLDAKQVVIWDTFDEKDKPWEKVFKLVIKEENYNQLIDHWNENLEHPANYLVFLREENGWITIEAKQELSQEDLDVIEEDKEFKRKYDKECEERWAKHYKEKDGK